MTVKSMEEFMIQDKQAIDEALNCIQTDKYNNLWSLCCNYIANDTSTNKNNDNYSSQLNLIFIILYSTQSLKED